MNDLISLDDQLKQAQIDKTNAEAMKLNKEAEAVRRQVKSEFWSEAIKILGGVVLGVGGVIVAYTQYEVSELKAKIAKDDLSRAQASVTEAEKLRGIAEASARAAFANRDAAIRELRDAEAATAELKTTLTQTNSALSTAKPNEVRPRLTYIQFRGDLPRSLINELRTALGKKSFNAPGAERVAGEYQNSVRYFKATENGSAEELAGTVETFFESKGCPLKLPVVLLSSSTVQNPPLEIWLAHRCTK